jgi:transposase-like protein
VLGELVRAVLERALEAEMAARLGYDKSERGGSGGGNARNGTTFKTVQTGVGPVPLQVPRDRAGTFEPLHVPKRAGRVAGGLDDMVISLYVHGMSVRDILHHLEQVYGTQFSRSWDSTPT